MYSENRDYYAISGVTAEDVIDGMNMLHREGAAIKYLFRCNKILPKGSIEEDLKKCRHYISRCLTYKVQIIRDYNAGYWLCKINPDVFSNDIYNAIYEIINAIGYPGSDYEECFTKALEYVNNAIEKY